jgi:hypothetical protein
MPRPDRASLRPVVTTTAQAQLDDAGRKKLAKLIETHSGDGKRFPDLTGGNVGVHGHEVSGARGQLLLDLAREDRRLGPDETVIALAITEDEPSLKLLIVNTKTLGITEAGDYSTYNDPPEAKDGTDLSDVDTAHFYWLLLKDTPKLPLKNGEDSWGIDDYRDSTGPKSLPALKITAPRAPAETLWTDDAGTKYLAQKMEKHVGTRFPALDAGKHGTHFFEVTGNDARRLNDIVGGYYVAKDDVLIAVLDTTQKQPKLNVLSLDRTDIGKASIDVNGNDTVSLPADLVAELLKGARELPVTGRREGFRVTQLVDGARSDAARTVGSETHRPSSTAGSPAVSPTSARIASMAAPFTSGTGKSVTLGGVSAKEMKLHADVTKIDDKLQNERESGDGSGISAWKMSPADLKGVLANKDKTTALLFDIVCGSDGSMGDLSEYGNFREKDVGRKGAFAAMGKMLYADGGDDDSYKGTPERKALDKTMGAFLDKMLADKDITKVIHVKSGDAGYGYNEGLIAFDEKSGAIHALVNSWAP